MHCMWAFCHSSGNAIPKQKVWSKVTFRLPKTQTLDRKPKVLARAAVNQNTFDKYALIKHPLTSESVIKTIEDHNTLVFIVDKRATKPTIKKACSELYGIKVKKVNTLNTPTGFKKAYVKIQAGQDALEIASKIGMM